MSCLLADRCKIFLQTHARKASSSYPVVHDSVPPAENFFSWSIFSHTEIAHLNFIGDSIIGSNCNLEAGSITANYFNERSDKTIYVFYRSERLNTGANKFGSLVGDKCKIGANAVLSPGTILEPGTVVKRLELVEQGKDD